MICQLRDSGLCAAVDRILARRPDRSRKPSSEESPPSPHVSLSDVTRHSPRRDASQQAKAPRRWAILSVLSRDCRLLRAKGDGRRRFARICDCHAKSREGECVLRKTEKTLREERAGRPSVERRETGGRGSPRAPRRTRGARSRLRGDEAPHGDSRMRAAGADARRTAARPRTARKRAIEAAGRNGRSAAEAYARRDELDQKSPTRRASGPQRGGPPAGRGGLGRTAACG